jgi:hypothetical protein
MWRYKYNYRQKLAVWGRIKGGAKRRMLLEEYVGAIVL